MFVSKNWARTWCSTDLERYLLLQVCRAYLPPSSTRNSSVNRVSSPQGMLASTWISSRFSERWANLLRPTDLRFTCQQTTHRESKQLNLLLCLVMVAVCTSHIVQSGLCSTQSWDLLRERNIRSPWSKRHPTFRQSRSFSFVCCTVYLQRSAFRRSRWM